MRTSQLLEEAFGRIPEKLGRALDGLSADQLTARVGPEANTIAWLAWHLTRGQDAQIADVAGHEAVWTAQGWIERFGLPFDASANGYGFTSEQVGQVRVGSPQLLLDYAGAVHGKTVEFLRGISDEDLDRVVDTRWDPPVTLGVRLVSILSDDLQHVGQAAFVRGLLGG